MLCYFIVVFIQVKPAVQESAQSPQFPKQSSWQSRQQDVNNNNTARITGETIVDNNGNKASETGLSATNYRMMMPG